MSELRVSACPACLADFETDKMVVVRKRPGGEVVSSERTVECANGHVYPATARYVTEVSGAEEWLLVMPEAIRGTLVMRATDQPCIGRKCGKPIQPGQAWLDREEGPLHIGCRA